MPRRILHDAYFRKAKAEGYLARSAYKLLEIQQRRGVLQPGQAVLDLGCAPGSWLQVASRLVGGDAGEQGLVVGLDLQPVQAPMPANVATMVGDLTTIPDQRLLEPLVALRGQGALYDAVISDMAPNTSGAGDHYRSVRLCEAILDRLPGILRPGGSLVYKVFEGEQYPALLSRTSSMFSSCRGLKPKATREVSRELYVVALGYEPALSHVPRPAGVAPRPPDPGPGWGGQGRR